MSKNNRALFLLVLLATVFITCTPLCALSKTTEVKAAYEQYIKSYNDFKAAAEQNLDEETLKKYSEKYQSALEAYNKLVKNDQQAVEETSEASAEITSNDTSEDLTLDAVKELTKELHSSGARDKIDTIIAKLEKIAKSSSSNFAVIDSKIELANAYAKFKLNYNKSIEILQEVVQTAKDSRLQTAQRALTRAKYLQMKVQLSSVISTKRAEAQTKKQDYQSVSWTSPIKKVKSLFTYYKSLYTYRKSTSEYRSYQEDGEKIPGYTNYEFLSDIFGKRSEFGVTDTFDNTSMPAEDTMAQVRLITQNNEAWYARWYMLNEAKQTIDMTYFIVEQDAYGKSMLGLLMKKANEGVKVRLMIDARGSKALAKTFLGQDYLQKLMICPNVQIRVFNPMHKALPSTFTNIRNLIGSNHQKIIVIDGELSITGGRNVSLNYFADPADNSNVFRDTDVLLKGAEIAGIMKEAFEEEFNALENFEISKDLLGNWSGKDKELIAAEKSMDKWIKGNGVYEDSTLDDVNEELSTYKCMVGYQNYEPFAESVYAPVKLFGKHNFQQERNDISANLIAFMDACTDEIIIQNPYVILTDDARAALKRASDRGVKIIIHTNSPVSTDSILTQAFFLKDWKQVMKDLPNARIFVFVGKNKLHAKVFVFDKIVSVVGTYNMDYMSEQINGEDVCAIKSEAFSKDCRNRIFEDIAQSKEYKIGIDKNGEAYEIYGPGSFTDKKTMFILETLMKLEIIKPLI